jgi:hypothetical protein
MDIESTISEAVEEAQRNGIKIVTDKWGIRNIENKWTCLNGECCPLGAVLLKHNLTFPASDFPKEMWTLPYNPSYSIIKLFEVDIEWIQSFFHGLFNSKICWYGNQKSRDLGLEYFKKFGVPIK